MANNGNGFNLETRWARLSAQGVLGILSLAILGLIGSFATLVWINHQGFAQLHEQHQHRSQEIVQLTAFVSREIQRLSSSLECNTWMRASEEERKIIRMNVGVPACLRRET